MSESIPFDSAAHKARFIMTIQQIEKVENGKLDKEYAAALYLLTINDFWDLTRGYISSSGIPFHKILSDIHFSETEKALLMWGANLFSEVNQGVYPVELMWMGERYFRIAHTALMLRRYGAKVDDLK